MSSDKQWFIVVKSPKCNRTYGPGGSLGDFCVGAVGWFKMDGEHRSFTFLAPGMGCGYGTCCSAIDTGNCREISEEEIQFKVLSGTMKAVKR